MYCRFEEDMIFLGGKTGSLNPYDTLYFISVDINTFQKSVPVDLSSSQTKKYSFLSLLKLKYFFRKNMLQCLKTCQFFVRDEGGGSSAFTPPIMLFARPVTLQPIVTVTWSFVPLTEATLYHIWRGLAEPLSPLHLPLNTLFVCVSPREWTIVPHPKGTKTKSLVFQFP